MQWQLIVATGSPNVDAGMTVVITGIPVLATAGSFDPRGT
jgi:hypothetical protein